MYICVCTYIVCRDKPGHLRGRGQLSINEALDFAFRPTIVYVHYGNHVPLQEGIRLIGD